MKNFISVFTITLLFCFSGNAQQYLNNSNLSDRPDAKKITFWDVEKAFAEYWKDKEKGANESENADEGGWEQFKRWEWFVKQRTFPGGDFPSPEILFSEHAKFKSSGGYQKDVQTAAANWSFIGPGVLPTNGGGSGRINCIAFDPTNTNIIWVGAACGGLWKSSDGGLTWSTNTDLLPSLSISDIVIDPVNPQIMYLATGDKYGIYYQYEVWGHYSAGVMKSTDGGATWNPTGMNYTISNGALIQRLIIDSSSSNILFAATKTGVFKTTDGGSTWSNVKTGNFFDIEMHPSNSSILYAADSALIYRSADGGSTWASMGITSSGRSSIAVSEGFPNTVYVWSSNGSLYYSNDAGLNFSFRNNPSSYCTPYGYYDMVLDVSPVNENALVAGGLEIALSTDGGTTWVKVSNWNSFPATDYVHADQKAFKFAPGSSSTIFACNDGGIFKTTNQCSTWTDLSNGIDIKQYYRFSSSYLTPSLMYAGAQDNGTDKITGPNTATRVYGADGEECLVDFTNDNVVFISTQGGYFYRSTDGGLSFNQTGVFGCDWTSPLEMDPNNNNVLYMGGSSIFKSTDNGVNWNTLPGSFDGTCMYSIEVAPSNSNYVYAATFGNIYKTTNGGNAWTNITGSLPVSSAAITGITINGTNPDAIWVSFSGFSSANKVYYSSNGGNSWVNVSGTLPNIPVNCIEYQNGSNDIVYIGTDLGVFYTDATLNNWVSYNTGLPNVIIDELEVYYPTSKLRAATFGRGIWESDLQTSTLQAVDASAMGMIYPPQSTCDTLIAPIVRVRNAGTDTITSLDLYYKMDAQSFQVYNWTGTLASFATDDITLPVYTITGGTHTLTAYTSNPNAAVDMNNLNDTLVNTFIVLANPIAMQPPVQEGFVAPAFPPASWALENSSGLFSRSSTVGGYSLSTQSAKADFFSISSGIDMMIAPYVDFKNLSPPIRLYFDVAYATYSASYVDSLKVDLYDDCSGIGKVVYKKGTGTLATAPPTTSDFVPISTQWRTDTINLDTMAGKSAKQIRFIAVSGFGNNLYIDNINISGTPVGIFNPDNQTGTVKIFPNPSRGSFTIQCSGMNTQRVEVFNLIGEMVYSIQPSLFNKIIECNMTQHADGIYFVKVIGDDFIQTEKITLIK